MFPLSFTLAISVCVCLSLSLSRCLCVQMHRIDTEYKYAFNTLAIGEQDL